VQDLAIFFTQRIREKKKKEKKKKKERKKEKTQNLISKSIQVVALKAPLISLFPIKNPPQSPKILLIFSLKFY